VDAGVVRGTGSKMVFPHCVNNLYLSLCIARLEVHRRTGVGQVCNTEVALREFVDDLVIQVIVALTSVKDDGGHTVPSQDRFDLPLVECLCVPPVERHGDEAPGSFT
jgi:hypothetical protein